EVEQDQTLVYPDPTRPATAPEPAVPAWHTGDAAIDAAIDLAPLNPSPAGRERLELAIAYLDLGDLETARSLLHEVAAGHDPPARDEALLLLR
ncbi:MAG TPA: FimV/HubP family polar landmark protein, partial [Pseudoxanthomonas sp.]|nr:FimV/HubP family polar landmark protein [Pseudoxanthomonas sp.]